MSNRKPVPDRIEVRGAKVHNLKNIDVDIPLNKIVGIAEHSETREMMVVYQALYGDFKMYVRPYTMFMSPVDKEKYPEIKQEFRFERVKSE